MYLKFDEFFRLRRQSLQGRDQTQEEELILQRMSVEAALEQQDGSGELLGAAAPPPMAAP